LCALRYLCSFPTRRSSDLGQGRLNFGATDVMLSLRLDDNEAFGKEETGGIAIGHQFDRSHRVRLSYATSFRAPTFNDLYLTAPRSEEHTSELQSRENLVCR